VVFYFPVAVVFLEGVVVDGLPSLAPLRGVLTDPFYVGVLADLFSRPTAVGDHLDSLFRWAATGFSRPSLGLIGFTGYQALLSTVASVAIGLPGAYILARYEFRGRRLLRSLTILPFVLPGIMVAIGFFAMFSTNGPLNALLGVFGVGPVEMLFTLEIIVLAHAFYNAPLVARLATAAWEGVDARTIETARSLGASRRRAFFDVLAPQLAPAVLAGAVLTFVFTFRTFPIVLALGGLEMATIEVWIFSRIQQLDLTTAAALAIVETVISIGVLALYLRFESRQYGAGQAPTQIDREPLLPSLRALFRPSRVAISVYGVFVAVLFIGPMASMIAESLTGPNGLTLSHYAFLFDRQSGGTAFQIKPWPAVRNSLLFAGATLVIACRPASSSRCAGSGVTVAASCSTCWRRRRWRSAASCSGSVSSVDSCSACHSPVAGDCRSLAASLSSPLTPPPPIRSWCATSRRQSVGSTCRWSSPHGRWARHESGRWSTSNCRLLSPVSSPARRLRLRSVSESSTRP